MDGQSSPESSSSIRLSTEGVSENPLTQQVNPEQVKQDMEVASKWNAFVHEHIKPGTRVKDFIVHGFVRDIKYQLYVPDDFSGNWDDYPESEHTVHLLSLLCPQSIRNGRANSHDVRRELDAYAEVCKERSVVFDCAANAQSVWQAYAASNNEEVLNSFNPQRDIVFLPEDRFTEVRFRHGRDKIHERIDAMGYFQRKGQGKAIVLHTDKVDRHLHSTDSLQDILSHELGHYIRDGLGNELPYRIFEEDIVESTSREAERNHAPRLWQDTSLPHYRPNREEHVIAHGVLPYSLEHFFSPREEQVKKLRGMFQSDREFNQFYGDCEATVQRVYELRAKDSDFSLIRHEYTGLEQRWSKNYLRFFPVREAARPIFK